jgi:hypothetical protein
MKRGRSNKEIWVEADALLQIPPLAGSDRRANIMPYAVSSTAASNAPHRKNAALPNQSPYQQRTTQKDNPTQQLIKQAVDFLLQQLAAGKSETLTAYLAAMARFHSYSFGNILAIARQRPTATRVAGFSTWKELGRFVKKGEKGTLLKGVGAPMEVQQALMRHADITTTMNQYGETPMANRREANSKVAEIVFDRRSSWSDWSPKTETGAFGARAS